MRPSISPCAGRCRARRVHAGVSEVLRRDSRRSQESGRRGGGRRGRAPRRRVLDPNARLLRCPRVRLAPRRAGDDRRASQARHRPLRRVEQMVRRERRLPRSADRELLHRLLRLGGLRRHRGAGRRSAGDRASACGAAHVRLGHRAPLRTQARGGRLSRGLAIRGHGRRHPGDLRRRGVAIGLGAIGVRRSSLAPPDHRLPGARPLARRQAHARHRRLVRKAGRRAHAHASRARRRAAPGRRGLAPGARPRPARQRSARRRVAPALVALADDPFAPRRRPAPRGHELLLPRHVDRDGAHRLVSGGSLVRARERALALGSPAPRRGAHRGRSRRSVRDRRGRLRLVLEPQPQRDRGRRPQGQRPVRPQPGRVERRRGDRPPRRRRTLRVRTGRLRQRLRSARGYPESHPDADRPCAPSARWSFRGPRCRGSAPSRRGWSSTTG